VSELRKQLKSATGVHASKTSIWAIASGNLADAQSRLDAAVLAIQKWDEQKKLLDESNRLSLSAWTECNTAYTDAQKKIASISEEITALNSRLSDKSASEALAKIPGIETRYEQARVDYKLAKATSDAFRQSVADLEDQHKQLLKERGEASTRANTIAESKKYKAEVSVLKELVDLLSKLQSEIVQASVSPIIESCNRLFKAVLGDPLEFKDGEIGMKLRGSFVSFKTLCGVERVLAMASISIALAVESPMKIAFIDLSNGVDAPNKLLTLNVILDLIGSGHLHQALLIDTESKWCEDRVSEDFGIINL
jgi:hypothetical protein